MGKSWENVTLGV